MNGAEVIFPKQIALNDTYELEIPAGEEQIIVYRQTDNYYFVAFSELTRDPENPAPAPAPAPTPAPQPAPTPEEPEPSPQPQPEPTPQPQPEPTP